MLVPLALIFAFNGCPALTALQEAQQKRREKRILEERNAIFAHAQTLEGND